MSKREREEESAAVRAEADSHDDHSHRHPHSHDEYAVVAAAHDDTQARKKQRVNEDGTFLNTSASSASLDEVRLLISSSAAGAVIGKGGANISQLRASSGCLATILKNESNPSAPERVLLVKGSVAQLTKAMKLAIELLSDAAGRDSRDTRIDDESRALDESKQVTLSLLVHKQLAVAAITGQDGHLLADTQADTHAQISVSAETLGQSTDKSVTINGALPDVHAALVRLITQLHDSPLDRSVKSTPYLPGGSSTASSAPAHPRSNHSQPPPPPPHQQPPHGMPMPPYGMPPPPPHGMPMQPYPQAAVPGMPPGYPPQQPYGYPPAPYGYPPPPPYGYPPHPYTMPPPQPHADPYAASAAGGPPAPYPGAPRPPRDRFADPSCTTQRIAIPSVCSGVVIGHGGSIVRELVRKSGAKISLAAPDPATPTERVVTITGTPEQIQAAIYLIQQQVENYTPGKPPPPPAPTGY